MSKFERKFGKYAIRNLSLALVMCYAAGYLIQMINIGFVDYLTLNPYLIMRGQIWRLVTWILIPPQTGNLFFLLIMLFFYYSIGTTLERTWGTYRYNVYLFSGMLFTVLGSFLCMGLCYLFYGEVIKSVGAAFFFQSGSIFISTYYVNMSIFLAYAATFPEAQVLLMFVIPIKVKWLGIVYAVMLLFDFIQGTGATQLSPLLGYYDLFYRTALAASLLNFVVFFFTSKRRIHMSPKQVKRRQEFKSQVKKNPAVTKHKCAICGRTDESNPELEFRFCSKCDGNYEYCQEHLFTHQHVTRHSGN